MTVSIQAERGRAATVAAVIHTIVFDGAIKVFRVAGADALAARCVAPASVMADIAVGQAWRMSGCWSVEPVHGKQFLVERAVPTEPDDEVTLIAVISKDANRFPGIGHARARKLWECFGDGLLDLLDAGSPTPFEAEIGQKLADVVVEGWRLLGEEGKAHRWLVGNGLPARLASKVVAIYGGLPVPADAAGDAARLGRTVWHLIQDPYRMMAFAAWRPVDACARRSGVGDGDERRLVGAVEAALSGRFDRGDTWVTAARLSKDVKALLGCDDHQAERALSIATTAGAAKPFAGGLQASGAFVMERFVETEVRSRLTAAPIHVDPGWISAFLEGFEATERLRIGNAGYVLAAEQRQAVAMALRSALSLLAGGPGVGKTTALRAVVEATRERGGTVRMAALSGRAARRMKEATGSDATTLAALLLAADRGDLHRLVGDVLLVVDEASMVDLLTAYRLLRRLPASARILLVGDPGQLPPIGPGLTFHVLTDRSDLAVPVTTLNQVHRQTAASGIPAVCAAIRAGQPPRLDPPDFLHLSGVSMLSVSDEQITRTVVDAAERAGGIEGIQVVGSVKGGGGGVDEINAAFQAGNRDRGAAIAGRFRSGDRVIVTRNDYDLDLMNGDLGIVLDANTRGGMICRFDGNDIDLPPHLVNGGTDLGYAVTCHKAQGSGFPVVIVPVTKSRLLDRTLLLTAISRAETAAIVVGDEAVFREAIQAPPRPALRTVGLFKTMLDGEAIQEARDGSP